MQVKSITVELTVQKKFIKARQYEQGKAEVTIQSMRRELLDCDRCCSGRLAQLYRAIDLVNEIKTESYKAAMAITY